MLLFAINISSLQCRWRQEVVRWLDTHRSYSCRSRYIYSDLILASITVGFDSCEPYLARLSRRCWLSVECDRRQCRRSYERGKGLSGKQSVATFIGMFLILLSKPLKENKFVIPKSRYDSVDLYISNDWINRPEYNDNPLPHDEKIYERLRNHGELSWHCTYPSDLILGLDDLLSKHISHLFIRDPLVVFSETIDQDDTSSSDHFEVNFIYIFTFTQNWAISISRIFSQRIGKPYGSNHRRRILPLDGESNSVAWRYRWQTSRMLPSQFSLYFCHGPFSASTWTSTFLYLRWAGAKSPILACLCVCSGWWKHGQSAEERRFSIWKILL